MNQSMPVLSEIACLLLLFVWFPSIFLWVVNGFYPDGTERMWLNDCQFAVLKRKAERSQIVYGLLAIGVPIICICLIGFSHE